MSKSIPAPLDASLAHALQTVILANSYPSAVVGECKALIPEGAKVAFDLRADVKGILTRAKGYEVKPTSILLTKAVLARLLRNLGATREAAKQALLDAATEALEFNGSTSDALLQANRELLMMIDEVDQDIIARLPKVHRAGSVKVMATVACSRTKLEPQNL